MDWSGMGWIIIGWSFWPKDILSVRDRSFGDFPGFSVKISSCNAGDAGLIPGLGTKIPHTMEHTHWPQLESPCAATKDLSWQDKDPSCHNQDPHSQKQFFVCLSSFCCLLWLCCSTYRILVPQPRIEPQPSKVRERSSNPWTARGFLTEGFW